MEVKEKFKVVYSQEADVLVIATHGFTKKTQKTPGKEIAKAERIRKEYFTIKKSRKWKK